MNQPFFISPSTTVTSSIQSKIKASSALVALFGIALAVFGLPTHASETTETAAFNSAIRAKYDMKEAAFAANDPEPILTRFYHPDVISTGPDGSTHVGRAEIRPVYEEVIGGDVRIESYQSFVRGDAGWDWVNFHVTPPAESGEAPFTFKMLFLWEQEDGEWWSHGEMYVVGEFPIE
ncbi:MAG: nuclear transport factor 2 family protein [Halieaceae bacterium]